MSLFRDKPERSCISVYLQMSDFELFDCCFTDLKEEYNEVMDFCARSNKTTTPSIVANLVREKLISRENNSKADIPVKSVKRKYGWDEHLLCDVESILKNANADGYYHEIIEYLNKAAVETDKHKKLTLLKRVQYVIGEWLQDSTD